MRILLILYGILWLATASAQQASVALEYDTIYITESKSLRNKYTGSTSIQINQDASLVDQQNLAQLLNNTTSTYIRSYGIGSSATLSIRGGSSAHSLLLWNGIPVKNPMLGISDLSLVNSNAFNEIRLVKGGYSSTWGSGAIGGIVELNNEKQDRSNSLESSMSIGSFGYQQWDQDINLSHSKFESRTSIRVQSAINNFQGTAQSRVSNADQQSHTLIQKFSYNFKPGTQLWFHYWNSSHQRQIPPTINQSRSLASQDDKINRYLIHFDKTTSSGQLNVKTAFFDETVSFQDPLASIDNDNRFRTFFIDLQYEFSLRDKHILLLGSSFNANHARSNNYETTESEKILAFFGKLALRWKKVSLDLSIRQEQLWGQALQLLPDASLEFQISESLTWKTKIGRNYRLAGMNDRYWRPGGNSDLLPESGWSAEAGIHYNKTLDNNSTRLSLTGFNRVIDNWILWTPDGSSPFFMASNLNSVWSRGLEISAFANRQLSFGIINTGLQIDLLRSTSQESITLPSIRKGEQIWYTPRASVTACLGITSQGLNVNARINRVSSTRGFNGSIDAFTNLQLNLAYSQMVGRHKASIYFSLDNLLDNQYFIIENRPMPGRNFRFGIKIKLKP